MWHNTWQLKGISLDVMYNDNTLRWQFSVWKVNFAIKSKGGVCWHYDIGVVLDGNLLRWQITAQAHIMKKKRYTQVTLDKAVYTHRLANKKVRIHIHALSCKGRRIHWALVRGIWTMVVWFMVLVQGILSDVLTPGIWSKVLVLSGFGPWYWTSLNAL